MKLIEKIENDFQKALKEKKEQELSVLRLIKAAIEKEKIAQKGKNLSDQDIQKIIKKEIKSRNEASEMYEKGGRGELAEKESQEKTILEEYLPEQLSETEVKKKVEEVIEKMGAEGPQDLGKVMGAVMKEFRGQADGNQVNKIAKELLNK